MHINYLVSCGGKRAAGQSELLSRAGPALPVLGLGGDSTIYNLQIIYGAHFFHLSEIHNMPPVALKPCDVCSDGEAHTNIVGLQPDSRV